MRMKAFLLASSVIFSACGTSSDPSPQASKPASVPVSVTGRVAVLRIPPAAPVNHFADLTVHVVNPAALMVNPKNVSPLGSAALDTAGVTCTSLACPFAVGDVNIVNASMGLVAQVQDTHDAGNWAPAYTGIVSPDQAKSAIATKTGLSDTYVYALPTAGLQTLANLLSTTPEALVARGVLIGIVANPLDASGDGAAVPLEGATVVASGLNAARLEIYFPDDDFSTVVTGGTTNKSGIFLAVGTGASGNPFTTTLTMTHPDAAFAWTPQMAGIGPSFVLITAYPAA